jgi:hypothetical protein
MQRWASALLSRFTAETPRAPSLAVEVGGRNVVWASPHSENRVAWATRPHPTPDVVAPLLLLLFVDKRTFVSWSIWIPPRVGNDSSIVAQFQRSLSENFAIALRQRKNLTSSSKPYRVSRPLRSVRPMHRRVDSIERCVNILTRARIADMQGLTVEPQRHRHAAEGSSCPATGQQSHWNPIFGRRRPDL